MRPPGFHREDSTPPPRDDQLWSHKGKDESPQHRSEAEHHQTDGENQHEEQQDPSAEIRGHWVQGRPWGDGEHEDDRSDEQPADERESECLNKVRSQYDASIAPHRCMPLVDAPPIGFVDLFLQIGGMLRIVRRNSHKTSLGGSRRPPSKRATQLPRVSRSCPTRSTPVQTLGRSTPSQRQNASVQL